MQGRQLSHYRLTEKLGRGTYGEVWKGVHVHDEQLAVAVKVMRAVLADDPEFLAALKGECRVLSRLHHPHIVGFRDLALGDDHPPAMVMELVTGGSLEDRLAKGAQPVDSVVAILDAMLAALGYAHDEGVVHRDVKPGNVLLDDRERVRVVDFGVARAADSGQATKTGMVVGTLDYVAPEVVKGQKADAAADVYAAGLVAWELLAGRRACPDGPMATKLGWHMAGSLADVRTERSDCPAWLADVLATLTTTDRSQRPADGRAARELLQTARATARNADSASRPAASAPGMPETVSLSSSTVAEALRSTSSTADRGPVTVRRSAASPGKAARAARKPSASHTAAPAAPEPAPTRTPPAAAPPPRRSTVPPPSAAQSSESALEARRTKRLTVAYAFVVFLTLVVGTVVLLTEFRFSNPVIYVAEVVVFITFHGWLRMFSIWSRAAVRLGPDRPIPYTVGQRFLILFRWAGTWLVVPFLFLVGVFNPYEGPETQFMGYFFCVVCLAIRAYVYKSRVEAVWAAVLDDTDVPSSRTPTLGEPTLPNLKRALRELAALSATP